MTLLSQSLELLRRARALLRELESEGASPAPLALPAAQPPVEPKPLLSAPRLRLAFSAAAEAAAWEAADGCDNSIRGRRAPVAVTMPVRSNVAANEATGATQAELLPGPLSSGAEAFLAGHGARVYSLEVWRRTHPRGRTPHAA
jgi:hypothetical protein